MLIEIDEKRSESIKDTLESVSNSAMDTDEAYEFIFADVCRIVEDFLKKNRDQTTLAKFKV